MTFSIRMLLTLVAIITIALSFVHRTYRWYNHEIVNLNVGGGYELRLWSYGAIHRNQWIRHVNWSVTGNGQSFPVAREAFGYCHVENVELHKSTDRNFICVSSPDHPALLLLGDIKNGRFFRHREFLVMPKGPYRTKWTTLLEHFGEECEYLDVENILAGQSLRP